MPQSKLAPDFEHVILPHLNSAYNLARWLLRNEQDAQDVVHDSFLRAHRYFDSFDGSDGRAWLLGIVRNACFTSLRSHKTQQLPPSETLDIQSGAETSPERIMILQEDIGTLRNCIEALPPEYREVVVLRELEELSYKDISKAAGIALGTVMSRLNRARLRLEACLKSKAKEGRQ
ncbi:MAG: sigma-70 family RNA polymerase sigma factor [Bryobacteraceae bacterium]